MTATAPSALLAQASPPVGDLPLSLDELEPAFAPAEHHTGEPEPLTLFLTVDVEDSYFDRPILMAGDGIGREFGVFGILDQLDAHGLRGTFFVNVYEKDRQPPGAVEGVVREIAARGHEVGLHSHPSWASDFYRRPLFRLEQAAQAEVLRRGAELIAKWTGEPPTSFRGGGYAVNDDTFAALAEVGVPLDSSCFFPSPNNHNTRHTVNAPAAPGPTLEMPVTTVLRANGDRHLAQRKLDLDWLAVDELIAALDSLAAHGASHAMFMMHSFSFIEKRTRMPDEPPSPEARFVSEVDSDRYVEVFGPKPAMRDAFATFLDRLAAKPNLKTGTLRDALPDLRRAVPAAPDVIPIVT